MQPQYRTMADVRAANAQAAPRFFRDNVRWSVVCNSVGVEQIFGGRYFITVEYDDIGTPRYQVREALPTGQVMTVRRFDWYTTRTQARDLIRELLATN